jgi:hypothetical protein
MLPVYLEFDIFADGLLVAPFTPTSFKLSCMSKLAYSGSRQILPDVASLVCLLNICGLSRKEPNWASQVPQAPPGAIVRKTIPDAARHLSLCEFQLCGSDILEIKALMCTYSSSVGALSSRV